ncbi:MAG: type II toxin-antitoxin system Phd/YefM family antitoxin [Proteobacteria bacterium]|jgi:prevent-host-death family protein|nr:type II toxin-antitoxin system Phd/YefM family antitoxin [Pseudomonadota bacterium]
MKDEWQLQEAKNRFSEVVERALKRGPQTVTRRGVEAVVVVAADEFRRLSAPSISFVEFLRSSPLVAADLDVTRDPDPGREVSF